jgi:hypothetical protein
LGFDLGEHFFKELIILFKLQQKFMKLKIKLKNKRPAEKKNP